jgi:predicted  nucleic acid-binding Zn-ribbon protein
VKDQLLLLLELQKIDARVLELRASMEALPEKLKPAKQDLAKLEAMLQVERDRIAETEAWRREQEQLIAADQEALKKAKAKVQQSKSSKDFAAANREVDNKRRAISEREEEVLKVIEAMEASRSEIDAHEKDVETLRNHVEEEEKKVLAKVAELEKEVAEQSADRPALVEKLDTKLLKRYEHILRGRGVAVAPVVDGTCRGCHMAVPPQLNNILARGETIESCPRCQRLLYRQDWFDEVIGDTGTDG